MTFDDKAFDFIPWAQPLSDPRKSQITVKQLLNHTSGITPEGNGGAQPMGPGNISLATRAIQKPNGWHLIRAGTSTMGHTPCHHASLVCENAPASRTTSTQLKRCSNRLAIEKWWFDIIDGGEKHRSSSFARDRDCLLGNWRALDIACCRGALGDRQVVPEWFVRETAAPTHAVTGIKSLRQRPQSFSHGWEFPGLPSGGKARGFPRMRDSSREVVAS